MNTKISLHTNLSTTNPTWIWLRLNPDLRSERLTNSRLSQGKPSWNIHQQLWNRQVLLWSFQCVEVKMSRVVQPGNQATVQAETFSSPCWPHQLCSLHRILPVLQQTLLSLWYTCLSLLVNSNYHPVLIIKEKLTKLYIRSCIKFLDLVIS